MIIEWGCWVVNSLSTSYEEFTNTKTEVYEQFVNSVTAKMLITHILWLLIEGVYIIEHYIVKSGQRTQF